MAVSGSGYQVRVHQPGSKEPLQMYPFVTKRGAERKYIALEPPGMLVELRKWENYEDIYARGFFGGPGEWTLISSKYIDDGRRRTVEQ